MYTKNSNLQTEILELVRTSPSKLVAIDFEFCTLEIASRYPNVDRTQVANCIKDLSRQNPQWIYNNLIKTFVESFTNFCKEDDASNVSRWPTIPEVSTSLNLWFGDFVDPQILAKMTSSYTIRKVAKDLPAWKSHLASRRGPHQKRDLIQNFESLVLNFKQFVHTQVRNQTKDPREDLIEFAKFMFEVSSFDSKKIESFAAQALVQQFLEAKA